MGCLRWASAIAGPACAILLGRAGRWGERAAQAEGEGELGRRREAGTRGAEGADLADRWVERAGLARALERWAGPGVRKWAGEKKTREGERAAVWAGLLGWVGLSSFSFFYF